MGQLELFTGPPIPQLPPRELGQQGEDLAIAAVSPEWRTAALNALVYVCRFKATFLVDDVWSQLGERKDHPDKRAMAGILSHGEQKGYCQRTTELRRSAQKGNHGNLRAVWRSLLV